MTTRIDEQSTRYLIPGADLGPAAAVDADGVEEDYADAPYSQMTPVGEMPLASAWQDLLGLNQIPPSPNQIDPPPRPIAFSQRPNRNPIGEPWRLLENPASDREGVTAVSPKVERMIAMLARYERTARYIRARASEGGVR